MAGDPSPVKSASEEPVHYLVGSIDDINCHLNFCPHAATLTAHSMVLGCTILCQVKCKRWGCRHCGPRRIASLAFRVKSAKPDKFITLTVKPACWRNPREAFDETRRKLSQISGSIRRKFGPFEYLRILEVTKKGWPHYHLMARCGYVPQKWLSARWDELTGARIVDIRKVNRNEDVYFYVLKYLSKCKHIPWTNRRVSWTREFFPKDSKPKGLPLDLQERIFHHEHPSEILNRLWKGKSTTRFNGDIMVLTKDFASAKYRAAFEQIKHLVDENGQKQRKAENPKPEKPGKTICGPRGTEGDTDHLKEKEPAERQQQFRKPGWLSPGPY